MSLKEKRESIVKALKAKQTELKSGTMSDDDIAAVKGLLSDLDEVNAAIDKANQQTQLVQQISALKSDDDSTPTGNDDTVDSGDDSDDDTKSAPVGVQFVRAYERKTGETRLVKGKNFAFETKAASDPLTEAGWTPTLTQIDRNPVMPYQRPLTVAGLFAQGTIGASNNAIQYPVFGSLEGNPTTVGEGKTKPQIHFADPTWVTDALKEVAGYFVVSDNMLDDLDWLQSEITSFASHRLQEVEEDQLISGDGTGDNLQGILKRGIQTLGQDSKSDADRLFETRRLISGATGFNPDGLVINPADYEAIRLSRDSNGQYYGGGYFTGAYGNGGVLQDPPLWGLRTVVTEAIPVGTALVGAFEAGGKVLRKGGLRVESTNSNGNDFVSDRVTIRLKERLALQVEYPKAFVAVMLGQASGSAKPSK